MSGHTDSPPPLAEQARELLLRVRELEATVARVRTEVDAWADASSEWYYEHRHDAAGTTYACGFEDGWDHAEERLRQALDGDQ